MVPTILLVNNYLLLRFNVYLNLIFLKKSRKSNFPYLGLLPSITSPTSPYKVNCYIRLFLSFSLAEGGGVGGYGGGGDLMSFNVHHVHIMAKQRSLKRTVFSHH